MSHNSRIFQALFCSLKTHSAVFLATIASTVAPATESTAQPPEVALTQVGSPIWRVTDFQLFSAPALTDEQFFGTIDKLLPLEGPGATTYTPHAAPYDNELSTNAATAGLVSRSVFPREAIMLNPNGIYLHMMMLPAPGVTGSSRDFASGPVIPNSVFPMTSNVDIYRNGVLVDRLLGADATLNPRGGDLPHTGASHRAPGVVVWHPWDDNPSAGAIGNYELRWSLVDAQSNGWNIVAPFRVVPEPSTLVIGCFAAIGIGTAARRMTRRVKGSQPCAA
jgi:hypothetical protein